MEENDIAEEFKILVEDLRKLAIRARDVRYLEAKQEFGDNLYPLLETFVELTMKRFDENETVIAESLEPTESILLPEFTNRIITVLAVGERLASVAEALFNAYGANLDEMTAKRLNELLEGRGTVLDWANGYRADAQQIVVELQEVTIEEDEEEGESTGSAEEEETTEEETEE